MTINKKKLGKKIYYDGNIWTVIDILAPTKFDTFILLSIKDDNCVHDDKKTNPITMICIDVHHNDTFYPYNKKTKDTIDKLIKNEENYKIREAKLEDKLCEFWLECVR